MEMIITRPSDPRHRVIIEPPTNPETGVRYHTSASELLRRAERFRHFRPGDKIDTVLVSK